MGKTRDAPLKQWSVSRLELQAAVIPIRLHTLIREELDFPVHGVSFWTDSLTALQYISNKRRRFLNQTKWENNGKNGKLKIAQTLAVSSPY